MTQSLEERREICRNDKQFSLETEFLREYSSEEPEMTDLGYTVYKRCVDAETPVLTGDLKWVPAGELDKGDEIIGFDEEPIDNGKRSQRYFRAGEVTSNHVEPAVTMGIELEDGRTLYATPDHEWLVKFDSTNTEVQWRETKDLGSTKKGTDVYLQEHFGKPWSSEQTYEEGYIAGAYDGEGHLDRLSGLNFSQVDNAMKQKMEQILSDEDIEYTQGVKNNSVGKPDRQECYDLRFHGCTDIARLLGRTQPERLVENFMTNLKQGKTQSEYGQILRCDPDDLVKVENVFDAGERDIAMLSTDVSTHFTGGPASHNTYSRRLGNGETEEWWQTVKRVVEGVYTTQKRHYDIQDLEWDEDEKRTEARQMYEKIFNFKFTPPGRGLWAMGSSYIFDRETSAPLFNCSNISTRDIDEDFTEPFCYMMDMSMLGVGVGFDTRGKGEMTIKEPEETDETYVVPDSREGWVESVRTLLEGYAYGDEIPGEFDYSEIRDEGEPLKGFGGTSSGSDPLEELHENIHKLLKPMVGEDIDAPTIVDLMNLIGKCVVAGNVRRSAQICIGEPDNEDYLSLKDPDEQTDFWGEDENEHHRWAANLSINAERGMDYSAPAERTAKNGEPGYIWLENAKNNARMGHNDMPEDSDVLGTNPCVTGDTLVQTPTGHRKIKDLAVIDQQEISVDSRFDEETEKEPLDVFETGVKQTLTVETFEGYSLDVTPDHRIMTDDGYVSARHLEDGDTIRLTATEHEFHDSGSKEKGRVLGWFVGDGTVAGNSVRLDFYEDKSVLSEYFADMINEGVEACHVTVNKNQKNGNDYHSILSSRLGDIARDHKLLDDKLKLPYILLKDQNQTTKGFLQGLFSADGSVQGTPEDGASIRLHSVDEEMLEQVQQSLLHRGIYSRIYTERKEAGERLMPNGKGGRSTYQTKALHELLITKKDMRKFQQRIGFLDEKKAEQLQEVLDSYTKGPYRNKREATVTNLLHNGKERVYDVTEPDTESFVANGMVVHNCAEICLEHAELCNLSESYPSNHENLEEWHETLRFAYVYAKTVTLLPNHNDKTDQKIRDNRRLGVSISGIIQAFNKYGRRKMLDEMDRGYEYLQELDEAVSDMWNVCESIRLTSVKPSGTVSRLADVTSGIHYPEAPHYTRNIRFNENSDVLDQLREAGYPTEPDKYSDNSTVVSFPMKKENIEKAKYDVSMWEQLENAAQVAEHWADNAVSITVTYDPETEADHIEDALELYEHRLKTVSFLPAEKGVYDQAPYIPISKEEYQEHKDETGELDLSGDTSEKIEKFCQGDKCEIDLSEVSEQ